MPVSDLKSVQLISTLLIFSFSALIRRLNGSLSPLHARTRSLENVFRSEGRLLPSSRLNFVGEKVKMVSEDLIHGEINRISNNYVKYASWFSDYNDAPQK